MTTVSDVRGLGAPGCPYRMVERGAEVLNNVTCPERPVLSRRLDLLPDDLDVSRSLLPLAGFEAEDVGAACLVRLEFNEQRLESSACLNFLLAEVVMSIIEVAVILSIVAVRASTPEPSSTGMV